MRASVIFLIAFQALQCTAFRPISTISSTSLSLNKKSSAFEITMNSDSVKKETDPFSGFVGGLGVAANMVCGYSLYVVKTTGCNIIPKYGVEGLLLEQGASFAAVVAIFIWSAVTKAKTGSGLPAGPGGMLGAAEGLSFLTVLGSVVVIVLNLIEFGGLTSSTACDGLEYTKALGFI